MPEKNIIIPKPEELEKLKKQFKAEGKEKIHVISDFDRTLTSAFIGGQKIKSVISILRDENYLGEEYSKKANQLYDKYRQIEINPEIPLDEKKRAMHNWWMEHFDLLLKQGLSMKDIEKVANSGKIKLREGALEFLDILNSNKIPLIILSSAGLGEEVISLLLKKEKKLYENTHIISNSFIWDKNNRAIAVKKPIIHSMNKDETEVHKFPFYPLIEKRKNVILMGDNLEDVDMIKGFKYANLIKIGFLNEETEKNIEKYKQVFDILILNDADMVFVNNLLKEIVK